MANFRPKDPIRSISSDFLNRVDEASEDFQLRKRMGAGGRELGTAIRNDRVKVRNDTEDDVRRGEVLEFTGFLLSEVRPEYFWFTGDTPDTTNVGWGIAVDPVPEDAIGTFQVIGSCIAYVDVSDAGHDYADVASGDRVLQSATSGPVLILYKPSGTGEKECVVLIDRSGGGGNVYLGKTDASHAKGASGTVSVWSGAAGSESDTGTNITAYNRFANVASGKWVIVMEIGGVNYLTAAECV